ncbi:fimbria/pilus outer membrane usher protein [Cupriavidus necator]
MRLRPLSAIALSLLAAQAHAVPGAAAQGAEVEFNESFLERFGTNRADISRYNKGHGVPAGRYLVDLYVNGARQERLTIMVQAAPLEGGATRPCFDAALVEHIGVDLAKVAALRFGPGAEPGATTNPTTNATADSSTTAQPAPLPDDACPSLARLVPGASATFDGGEQRLDVSVPQLMMKRSARGAVDPARWDEGVPALLLNYDGNAYHSEMQGASYTKGYLGMRAGLNLGAWRFRHQGSLNYDGNAGTRYQSVQTNLQRGLPALRSQLVLGDAFTDGSVFDSVGFRGVQLASDNRMMPESQRGYAPTIRGVAGSNARVQVRQGGNVLYETTVAPGPFEINDLYPTGYGGDLEVVITEADGSTRVSRVPYAAAVNALRPGVTRFGVTAGQYRNPSLDSHPLMFQGTLQHGLSNLLTGYGGVALAEGYGSALAGIALNTRYGAIGADVTHATTRLANMPDRSGQSLRLTYSKLITPTNTNLTLAAYRYSTSGFLGLADAMALRDLDQRQFSFAMGPTQRGRLQLTVNQTLPGRWGSFYLSGSTQTYWNRKGSDTQFVAGYNNSIGRISLGVSASRQFNISSARWENRVMLNLGIPLGKAAHAPYSMTSAQTDFHGAASVQQAVTGSLGVDNAFTYGLNAGYNNDRQGEAASLGATASYLSPVATLTGSASTSRNYTQASAGISGGIVAYPGGVAFTPRYSDTVAVIEAGSAAGARVVNNNGARVDPWGHAVVSGLRPFARNDIEIDPRGLPLDVEFKSTTQAVVPTAGAVVVARFDTTSAGRAAVLRALTRDGRRLPFGSNVLDSDGNTVGTVGQSGRIVAQGLKADSGELVVRWGEAPSDQCHFHYALPMAKLQRGKPLPQIEARCEDPAVKAGRDQR